MMWARSIAGFCLAATWLLGWQAWETGYAVAPTDPQVQLGQVLVGVGLVAMLVGLAAMFLIPRDDRCTAVRRLRKVNARLGQEIEELERDNSRLGALADVRALALEEHKRTAAKEVAS